MSLQEPLVSILMPVKNSENYLKECLDSIRNQTYLNWELIAIDDYSIDNCHKILTSYSKEDSRIKVYKNINHGIIPALQLAYSKSSGKYITRMDSDDLMAENKIAKLLSQLQLKGNGYLAIGLVKYFRAGGVGNGYFKYANWLNDLTSNESNFEDIYKECPIPSPCWMIARSDFEKCGSFQSEVYPEDYDLAFRFRKAGFKIAPVKTIIHHWRDYNTRTSRTDSNYSDNRFSELKIKHFIDQDYNSALRLILWGAGKKGKKLAHTLINSKISFDWVCNNPNKIGREIYGINLKDTSILTTGLKSQVITAISSPNEIDEINSISLENNIHEYFRFF